MDNEIIRIENQIKNEKSREIYSQSLFQGEIKLPRKGAGSCTFHGIDLGNIVVKKRRRNQSHSVQKLVQLSGYHSVFSSVIQTPNKLGMHRGALPEAPKIFKYIEKNIHSVQFMQACDGEIRTLFEKGMFEYVKAMEVPDN